MLRIVVGVFLVLHGLVHLLYLGQGVRRFELRPGLSWPDGSWALSRLLGVRATRRVAAALSALSAAGFAASGVGLFAAWAWWPWLAVGSAVLSAVVFLLSWDGRARRLDDQGGFGVLIDVGIAAATIALA